MFRFRKNARNYHDLNRDLFVLQSQYDTFRDTRLQIYFDDCERPSFDVSLGELASTAVDGVQLLHFKLGEPIDRGAPEHQEGNPYEGM